MHTAEERLKAVKLYILQYDCSPSAVIRKLGYPSRNKLGAWYKEYFESGTVSKEGR